MKIFQLLALTTLCIAGSAVARESAQSALTPPPAFRALMGTELETLVRFHSILNNVCGNHSLDTQFQGKSMLLQVKLLGDLDALGDVHNSEELAWHLNVYYTAYGAGFKPALDQLEKSKPGTKASMCAAFETQAKSLVGKQGL